MVAIAATTSKPSRSVETDPQSRLGGRQRKRDHLYRIPRRWVVERTFAWLLNYRRHSKDYGVLTRNSEAFIQVAMIHLLIRRLAKK